MQMSIKDMPGNAGQEVLVDDLEYYCKFIVIVRDERPLDFSIDIDYDINLRSNHPEAIEVIMKTAEENGELIAKQATIPGPFDLIDAVVTGDWKIVGLDTEWKL